jgi:hypothetical protein
MSTAALRAFAAQATGLPADSGPQTPIAFDTVEGISFDADWLRDLCERDEPLQRPARQRNELLAFVVALESELVGLAAAQAYRQYHKPAYQPAVSYQSAYQS